MSYKEASKLLNLNYNRIRELVKENKLKLIFEINSINKQLDPESVYSYKKELDERRSIYKSTWVGSGGNFT